MGIEWVLLLGATGAVPTRAADIEWYFDKDGSRWARDRWGFEGKVILRYWHS